jgi:hypothetical protein
MTPDTIATELYKGKNKVRFSPGGHAYYVNGVRKTGVTTYLGIKDKSKALVSWAVDLYRQYLYDNVSEELSLETLRILIEEGARQHAIAKEAAATIGSQIHAWCEAFIKHRLNVEGFEQMPAMPEDQAVQIGVNAFMDWTAAHQVKFVSSERIVFSRKHDYIGTLDIEAQIDGKLCLVDLKSSNGLYNTVLLQTAAYVKADEEESGRRYEGRWAIRLAKETEEEYLARMEKKGKVEYAPYQVFEARALDRDVMNVERDFAAFLAFKHGYEWDIQTDFFRNK